MLPVIIRILLSHVLKKKGQQKNWHARLNIVYTFLSNLNPETEYPLVFAELLNPIGLNIKDLTEESIKNKLVNVSFGRIVQFIETLSVVFKQLGSLLNRGTYLNQLTLILICSLSQAKVF